MKTIRSLMTLAGLSVVLFALGATGAKAQAVTMADFAGTFTLSHPAELGSMVLPAGNYSLRYGTLGESSSYFVEVRGTAKGSPHGVIHVVGKDQVSTTKSVLVCIREGNGLIVRTLEMSELGTAATFSVPRGAKLVAKNGKHNSYIQLAQAPMQVERIPITLNAK